MSRLRAFALECVYITAIALFVGIVAVGIMRLSAGPQFSALNIGDIMRTGGPRQWSKDAVVLATSVKCHFCRESLGFHKSLILKAHELRMPVVILVGTRELAPKELVELLNSDDNLLVQDLRQLGISGTPTILTVDRHRRINGMWVGKMNQQQEVTVLARLKGAHTLSHHFGDPDMVKSEVLERVDNANIRKFLPGSLIVDIGTREVAVATASAGLGAIHIPLSELSARALLEIPSLTMPIVLDCSRLDSRACLSGKAVLNSDGFTQVWLLDDGAQAASCFRSTTF